MVGCCTDGLGYVVGFAGLEVAPLSTQEGMLQLNIYLDVERWPGSICFAQSLDF